MVTPSRFSRAEASFARAASSPITEHTKPQLSWAQIIARVAIIAGLALLAWRFF